MGDEGPDVAGGAGDQSESRDRAAATPEDAGRLLADGRFEHSSNVVGHEVRLTVLVGVVDGAAAEAPRVVGHDGEGLGQHRARCVANPDASIGWPISMQRRARSPVPRSTRRAPGTSSVWHVGCVSSAWVSVRRRSRASLSAGDAAR